MRAFGKDRAPETKAPARSITAAVPTPLGPPVGCHPTPSDGIAHANPPTGIGVGKGLSLLPPSSETFPIGLTGVGSPLIQTFLGWL